MVRLAAVASLAILVGARPAAAVPYETFIDITDQAELDDLLAAGDILEDTYNELLDLLQRGVSLNDADRSELYALPNLTYEDVDKIIAYRQLNQGLVRDPAELVAAGALSEEKLLAIAAFLVVREPGQNPLAVHGYARVQTRMSSGDLLPPRGGESAELLLPPLVFRSRITAARHLAAGIAITTTRLRIGTPTYDPNRDALIADPRAYRVHVPKAFLKWETDEATVIGGSYRAGFGQRLVFDNSSQYTPNGLYQDDQIFFSQDLDRECTQSAGELATSPCAGEAGDQYVTPDFTWRDGLFGLGAGFKRLEIGTGWLQGYVWASASARSIYQYELYERSAACEDPHDDRNPACAAPTVYVRPEGGLLQPTSRFSFETLPKVFGERLVGTNLTFFADRRNSVGATVFAARETNLVDGIDLDFQEWSRLPTGREFAAAGANFSFGRGWLDVFGEAALSFDRQQAFAPAEGGGGPAGILRMTATRKREELEAVFRYYSIDYVNPYARPISQPDEFDGMRARDETGVRLRYVNAQKSYSIRALLDVWVPLSSLRDDSILGRSQPKLDSYVRADVRTTNQLRLGLWVRYQDKDLRDGGHDQCYEVSTETSETGDPIPCSGRQLTTIARARVDLTRALTATGMIQHQLLDDRIHDPEAFRHDLALWGIALWHPSRDVRVRGRVRYLNEAVSSPEYLETSQSGLVDAGFRLRKRDTFRVRLDTKFWLDRRASTMDRNPNPELQVWLSYEARL